MAATVIVPSLVSEAEALPPTKALVPRPPSRIEPATALCEMPAPTEATAKAGPVPLALAVAPMLIVPLLVRATEALPCISPVAIGKVNPPVVVLVPNAVVAGVATATWRMPTPMTAAAPGVAVVVVPPAVTVVIAPCAAPPVAFATALMLSVPLLSIDAVALPPEAEATCRSPVPT